MSLSTRQARGVPGRLSEELLLLLLLVLCLPVSAEGLEGPLELLELLLELLEESLDVSSVHAGECGGGVAVTGLDGPEMSSSCLLGDTGTSVGAAGSSAAGGSASVSLSP